MYIFNDTLIRKALFFLIAAILISCSREEIGERPSGGNIDITIPDSPGGDENGEVNPRLGEVLNLDYPGLEKVKEAWNAGDYYQAAWHLREYYRERTNVRNPLVDLITTSISEKLFPPPIMMRASQRNRIPGRAGNDRKSKPGMTKRKGMMKSLWAGNEEQHGNDKNCQSGMTKTQEFPQ